MPAPADGPGRCGTHLTGSMSPGTCAPCACLLACADCGACGFRCRAGFTCKHGGCVVSPVWRDHLTAGGMVSPQTASIRAVCSPDTNTSGFASPMLAVPPGRARPVRHTSALHQQAVGPRQVSCALGRRAQQGGGAGSSCAPPAHLTPERAVNLCPQKWRRAGASTQRSNSSHAMVQS